MRIVYILSRRWLESNFAKYLFGTADKAYTDGEIYFNVQGCGELLDQLNKFPHNIDYDDDVADAFAYVTVLEKYKKKVGIRQVEFDVYDLEAFGNEDIAF